MDNTKMDCQGHLWKTIYGRNRANETRDPMEVIGFAVDQMTSPICEVWAVRFGVNRNQVLLNSKPSESGRISYFPWPHPVRYESMGHKPIIDNYKHPNRKVLRTLWKIFSWSAGRFNGRVCSIERNLTLATCLQVFSFSFKSLYVP